MNASGTGWDDPRIEAAFRARADGPRGPLPADLIEETLDGVRTIGRRRPLFERRGIVAATSAAAVLIVASAIGVGILGPGIVPASSPSGSAMTSSAMTSSSPTPSAGQPSTQPLGITALRLRDVDEAAAVRDAGVVDNEIRVQGFFAGIPTMYCPAIRFPLNPTRIDCAPATITQNRVPLSTAGSPARDPGATIVASFALVGVPRFVTPSPPVPVGSPATLGGAVELLTLIGHFDDRRADRCPAELIARCRDMFMVDRIDAAGLQSLPTATNDLLRDGSGRIIIPGARLSPDDVDRMVLAVDPTLTILSRRVQTSDQMPVIEPAWPASDPAQRNGGRILWLVTAMTAVNPIGRATVRTFVISDADGTLREITREGTTGDPTPRHAPIAVFSIKTNPSKDGNEVVEVHNLDGSVRAARAATTSELASLDWQRKVDPAGTATVDVADIPGLPGEVAVRWQAPSCGVPPILDVYGIGNNPGQVAVLPSATCARSTVEQVVVLQFDESIRAARVDVLSLSGG